jgi:hypothetical protein
VEVGSGRSDTQHLALSTQMLKVIYIISCVVSLGNGAWMLLFPLSWYTNLSGSGLEPRSKLSAEC